MDAVHVRNETVDKLVSLVLKAKSERDEAEKRYEDALRAAVERGVSFTRLGRACGLTEGGVRMLALRRGWYDPRPRQPR